MPAALAAVSELLSPALHLQNSQYGTGVFARQQIAQGDVLLRVPAWLCITSRRAHRTPELTGALHGQDVEAYTAIATWVMRAMDTREEEPKRWLA